MNLQRLINLVAKVTLSRRVAVFLTVSAVLSCITTYTMLI